MWASGSRGVSPVPVGGAVDHEVGEVSGAFVRDPSRDEDEIAGAESARRFVADLGNSVAVHDEHGTIGFLVGGPAEEPPDPDMRDAQRRRLVRH